MKASCLCYYSLCWQCTATQSTKHLLLDVDMGTYSNGTGGKKLTYNDPQSGVEEDDVANCHASRFVQCLLCSAVVAW